MLVRRLLSSPFLPRSLHISPPLALPPSLSSRSFPSSSSSFYTSTSMACSFPASDAARISADVSTPVHAAEKTESIRGLEATLGCRFSSEPLVPPSKPVTIVISGPSGVGKDAVIKRLREVRKGLHFVITATSRPRRPNEVDGKDYFFVSKERFLSMVEKNELLEYALVYGDYKGIPKQQIRDSIAKGFDVVLRVDIQGAATLRSILGSSAIFIFLVAESEASLVKRLVERKTEDRDALLVRIATAREELKHIKDFDYVVVNAQDQLENAVQLVGSIIDAGKASVQQRELTI